MIAAPKLGWMAGVLDLKGRLIFKDNRARVTAQVVLMVESKELGIIRELGSMTGTRPELKKAAPIKDFMRKGCIDHCPEPHVHVNEWGKELVIAPVARWTITGAGMVVVLFNVQPYLQIERGYTEAVRLVQQNTVLTGQGSGMVYQSLRRLRQLGWDLPEEYEAALLLKEGIEKES